SEDLKSGARKRLIGIAPFLRRAVPLETLGDCPIVRAGELSHDEAGLNLLYIHERFGALAGAEANVFITATELARRGHKVGILHGPSTGKNEAGWKNVFEYRRPLEARSLQKCVDEFQPDAFFIHKTSDLGVLEAARESKIP